MPLVKRHEALVAEEVGHAKVGYLEVALVIEEDVLRLEVAVADVVHVEVGKAVEDIYEEVGGVGLVEVALDLRGRRR